MTPAPSAPPATGPGPDLAALAAAHGMSEVGLRPSLGEYLRQLARRRDFVVTLARSGIAASNSEHRLGRLWLVLTPLLQAAVYGTVFGFLLDTRGDIENFVGYLLIGIFLFQYSARGLTEGSKAVSGNRKLIQVLSFPRAALPLAITLRQVLMFLPAFLVMVAVILLAPGEEVVTWRWLLLLPVVALLTLFVLGLTLVLARAVAGVSDVGQVIPFALRIWFYTSGVFFSFDRLAGDLPEVRAVLEANPMHIFLTLARDALLYGQDSPASYWWQAVAWAVGGTVVAFLIFWQAEETYTRDR